MRPKSIVAENWWDYTTLNREILDMRGVPGLAWTVDISLRALHENYHIDVEDPPVYPEDTE